MQDMIDRLARELAQAPEPGFDIASTVASGRKAVRRRRIAAGGAVLAAALVVCGTAWLVVPGDDGRSESSSVAVEPTPTPTPTATSGAGPEEEAEPVVTGTAGEPAINPAAEVIERDAFTASDGQEAEIYHVRLRAAEYYVYLQPDGASSYPLPAQGLTLREWAEVQLVGPDIEDDQWLRFDRGSHVTPVLFALEIVKQVPDPGLGANFAPAGTPTALVEARLDGATFYLAVRSIGGGKAEAISYRRDDQITTLQQFRTHAQNQYAENESGGSEGLR